MFRVYLNLCVEFGACSCRIPFAPTITAMSHNVWSVDWYGQNICKEKRQTHNKQSVIKSAEIGNENTIYGARLRPTCNNIRAYFTSSQCIHWQKCALNVW